MAVLTKKNQLSSFHLGKICWKIPRNPSSFIQCRRACVPKSASEAFFKVLRISHHASSASCGKATKHRNIENSVVKTTLTWNVYFLLQCGSQVVKENSTKTMQLCLSSAQKRPPSICRGMPTAPIRIAAAGISMLQQQFMCSLSSARLWMSLEGCKWLAEWRLPKRYQICFYPFGKLHIMVTWNTELLYSTTCSIIEFTILIQLSNIHTLFKSQCFQKNDGKKLFSAFLFPSFCPIPWLSPPPSHQSLTPARSGPSLLFGPVRSQLSDPQQRSQRLPWLHASGTTTWRLEGLEIIGFWTFLVG